MIHCDIVDTDVGWIISHQNYAVLSAPPLQQLLGRIGHLIYQLSFFILCIKYTAVIISPITAQDVNGAKPQIHCQSHCQQTAVVWLIQCGIMHFLPRGQFSLSIATIVFHTGFYHNIGSQRSIIYHHSID